MKKIAGISTFIFLTGLFAGIFFSTGLSQINSSDLTECLLSSAKENSFGFFRVFFSSAYSNYLIAVLMAAAMFSKFLCPLPLTLLWFKSFAIGFTSGLVYLNETQAFLISFTRLLPPNLFFIPSFVALATVSFIYSRSRADKSKRSLHEKKDLRIIVILSLAGILAGCITDAFCYMISI